MDHHPPANQAVGVDALTGVQSRRAILLNLEARLDCQLEMKGVVGALYVDIDELKPINDAYGHSTGDALLRTVSERLIEAADARASVGRLGGDEFLVIAEVADEAAAVLWAQDILAHCSLPMHVDKLELQPQVSIGVTVANARSTVDSLIADADMAMYEAKRLGAGVTLASDYSRLRMKRSVAVNTGLEAAMANRQIEFAYQPVFSLSTGEMLGAEALMRWVHPIFGPMPPALVVERAEAANKLNQLTAWTLEAVCAEWAALRQRWPLFHDKAVSVNMTVRQLRRADYAQFHHATVASYGLRPEDIIIEVVDSGVRWTDERAETTIKALAQLGTIIALDDFGVGYNSLGYFTRMPIHAIKADRTLIKAGARDRIARTLLSSVHDLARNLDVYLVAEGIENEDERAMCQDMGILAGQGYLLGRPKKLSELEIDMADEWRAWTKRKGLAQPTDTITRNERIDAAMPPEQPQ